MRRACVVPLSSNSIPLTCRHQHQLSITDQYCQSVRQTDPMTRSPGVPKPVSSRENHRVFSHVVHLSTFYEGGGGVERSIRELAEGLSNDFSENIESLCTHVGFGNTVKLINCVQVTSVGGPFKIKG